METIPIPQSLLAERARSTIEEHGTMRLSELADKLDMDREDVYGPLMEVVDDGDAAVFPVGNSVQVRPESD
jgi:hypothetical protein